MGKSEVELGQLGTTTWSWIRLLREVWLEERTGSAWLGGIGRSPVWLDARFLSRAAFLSESGTDGEGKREEEPKGSSSFSACEFAEMGEWKRGACGPFDREEGSQESCGA